MVTLLASWYRFNMKQAESKPPSGPKREALDVGLARHTKPKTGRSQRWFSEFGGWFVAALLVVVVLIAMYGVSVRQDATQTSSESLASLTLLGAPKKIWEEGSNTKVRSVQVLVGNQGRSRADEVRVLVVMGGMRSLLTGPAQIESGKSELFSGDVGVVVRPGQDLQVLLECANCR